MKTNTRNVFVGVILMIVMLLGISMLTACNDVSLDKLQNEYGIVIDGGGFEEGSTLVSNEIAVSTEEATEVLAAIADQNYDKDGSVYIFDIYVTKDGAKVQPSGKVKVSVPLPNIQVDNISYEHSICETLRIAIKGEKRCFPGCIHGIIRGCIFSFQHFGCVFWCETLR